MKLIISRHTAREFVFFIVFFSMTMLAFDKYNIKILFFLVYILLNVNVTLKSLNNVKRYGMLIFMILAYPVVVVLISTIMSGGDWSSALHAVYIHLFLLLVFVLLEYDIDVYKLFFFALSVEVVIILIIACMDFLHIVDLYVNPLTQLILGMNEGKISKSYYAMFYYVIFFNSSPLLIYHFIYALISKRYIWTFLSFVAILFTGTRANIYIAITVVPIYLFTVVKSKNKRIVISLIGLVLVAIFYNSFYEKVQLINYAKSAGDLVRTNTVSSIFDVMNNNPMSWLFGMGYGTAYYSYGRNAIITTSELSYIEMLRTIGILGSLPFIIFLINPIKIIWNSDYKWILIPYGSLLVSSIIDPFLYTSTSFIMYTVVYYTYYKIKNSNLVGD